MREKPSNTGLENFAADETDFRMAFGLNSKMLSPAETDLKPNVLLRSAENHTEFKSAFLRDSQSKLRQQFAHPDSLFRAKPSPASASEDQLTVCQLHESEKVRKRVATRPLDRAFPTRSCRRVWAVGRNDRRPP